MKTKIKILSLSLCLIAVLAAPVSAGIFRRKTLSESETGVKTLSIQFQGNLRTYDVHLPPSYDGQKPVPLVLDFHGGGGNSAYVPKQSGFNEKADQEGFIVVYPQGTGKKMLGTYHGSWNGGRMGGGKAYEDNIDDVGFVRAMLDDLESRYKIDKNRIFSTGISMGGMMSYRLACEMTDRIAAIAPVATALVVDQCAPSRPISVLHFQGTADRLVPYQGGPSDAKLPKLLVVGGPYPSTHKTIDFWSKQNQCSAASQITYQKGDVTCATYNSCAQGTEVSLCTVQGGGHTWPGGTELIKKNWQKNAVGQTTQDISATDAMWEFFKRHPKSA